MISWIQERLQRKEPLRYEDILSGDGLSHIYAYLHHSNQYSETTVTKTIDEAQDKALLLSQHRADDQICRDAFEWFTRFYARCAKNFALDTLATGGIYLAGGIAAKNPDIFSQHVFREEFCQAYKRTKLLELIPVYVIKNYNVSLLGACFAAGFLQQKTAHC